MILPGFILTVLLTVAYTLLAGSTALRVVNTTLQPAALGIVAVSTYRLAREFLSPSVELCMAILATISVLALGLNPSLVLIGGGVLGALVLRPRGAR
jgi:chromate transport protein ChrA